MKPQLWQTLIALVEMDAHIKTIATSSSELARKLGISQQTAARRLRDLEENMFITRETSPRGQSIRITKTGMDQLQETYQLLKSIFEKEGLHPIIIQGEVVSGIDEGSYYIQKERYRAQLIEKLDFTPYPGTLNLKLKSGEDIKMRQLLQRTPGTQIYGFRSGSRTYGPVKCFKAQIDEEIEGAIIIPERTHHGLHTLEIIAPVKLRDKLGLADGDIVTIKTWI